MLIKYNNYLLVIYVDKTLEKVYSLTKKYDNFSSVTLNKKQILWITEKCLVIYFFIDGRYFYLDSFQYIVGEFGHGFGCRVDDMSILDLFKCAKKIYKYHVN